MQLPTLAVMLSLAAFGSAQVQSSAPAVPTPVVGAYCNVNGQYACQIGGAQGIVVCLNGRVVSAATCAPGMSCQYRGGLPYCV